MLLLDRSSVGENKFCPDFPTSLIHILYLLGTFWVIVLNLCENVDQRGKYSTSLMMFTIVSNVSELFHTIKKCPIMLFEER